MVPNQSSSKSVLTVTTNGSDPVGLDDGTIGSADDLSPASNNAPPVNRKARRAAAATERHRAKAMARIHTIVNQLPVHEREQFWAALKSAIGES